MRPWQVKTSGHNTDGLTPVVERYDGGPEHHFAVSDEPLDWQVVDNKVETSGTLVPYDVIGAPMIS